MANYSLFSIAWNDAAQTAIAADQDFVRNLYDICWNDNAIPMGRDEDGTPDEKLPSVATPQTGLPLSVNGELIGGSRGVFYDARIIDTDVAPNDLVFIVKHDLLSDLPKEHANKIANMFGRFASAQPQARRDIAMIMSHSVKPVYYNDSGMSQTIEVHKSSFRIKNDPHTAWHYNPVTTYHTLVNV